MSGARRPRNWVEDSPDSEGEIIRPDPDMQELLDEDEDTQPPARQRRRSGDEEEPPAEDPVYGINWDMMGVPAPGPGTELTPEQRVIVAHNWTKALIDDLREMGVDIEHGPMDLEQVLRATISSRKTRANSVFKRLQHFLDAGYDFDPRRGDQKPLVPYMQTIRGERFFTFDLKQACMLSSSLLVYLFIQLFRLSRQQPIGAALTTGSINSFVQYGEDGPQSVYRHGVLRTWEDFWMMFITIWQDIRDKLLDDMEPYHWYGRETGDCFRTSRDGLYHLKITLQKEDNVPIGSHWYPCLEEDLAIVMGGTSCYQTVTNMDDNYCFLYCILMSLMHNDRVCPWRFRGTCCSVPSLMAPAHVQYQHNEDIQSVIKVIQRINSPEFAPIRMYMDSCDMEFPVEQYCSLMEDIEQLLFPFSRIAIDIIMIQGRGACARVFPLYFSRREVPMRDRISLACCILGNNKHYVVITDTHRLFSMLGGKTYEQCSKCHQAFFTRNSYVQHRCSPDGNSDELWHCSETPPRREERGRCEKCHLYFPDLERYRYHVEHCFMKNRRGSRYIALADYKNPPVLKGDKTRLDALPPRDIFFADFECFIAPETKLHEFMSYGIYYARTHEMKIGFSLEGFLDYLYDQVLQAFKREIYVYFHNAMGYDANFILRQVLSNPKYQHWYPKVIMKSMNRLQKLTFFIPGQGLDRNGRRIIRKIHIGDTLHFFTMSLEKIVLSFKKDDFNENVRIFPRFFEEMNRAYPGISDAKHNEILRKNMFPYNFFDDPEKLTLPIGRLLAMFEPINVNLKHFSSDVTTGDLEREHTFVQELTRRYRLLTIQDYHNLYLRCDVMEIADVFLNAREELFATHGIDICQYIGTPAASWAAFLKFNPHLCLPLPSSTFIAEFFEGVMKRGGVTSAVLRYVKFGDITHEMAKNFYGFKNLEEDVEYELQGEDFDYNGLYPHVMRKYKYPMGDFIVKKFDDIHNARINLVLIGLFDMFEKEGKGACFCVDLETSQEVQVETDDYPMAPEHRVISDEYFDEGGEMTGFLRQWGERNNGEKMKAFHGLVATHYPKTQYGVHWRLLQWYMNHGMEVRKLHFMIQFEEGEYLRDYVTYNMEKRDEAAGNEMKRMLMKLMSNSIYGKFLQSPLNMGSYEIVKGRERLGGLLHQGKVLAMTPIDGNNFIVQVNNDSAILDRPGYIGCCITEMAKLEMYQVFYDHLRPAFGGNLRLVYTDTDSLLVAALVKKGEKMCDIIERHDPGLLGNAGGQIKSEIGGEGLSEVIALRSKVYAFKTNSGKIGKKAKGTTAAAQEEYLTWDAYVQCLREYRSIPSLNLQFRRSRFTVATETVEKRSLSCNDGKRQICDDGIRTHAFGYPSP